MNVYFVQDLFSDSWELKLIFGLGVFKIYFRTRDLSDSWEHTGELKWTLP